MTTTTTRRIPVWAVIGLAIGFLLPYVISMGSVALLGDTIGDHAFYLSGGLDRWEQRSNPAILAAYLVGTAVFIGCYLALWPLRPGGTGWKLAGFAVFAIVQFVLVMLAGFIAYAEAGGIL